MRFEVNRQAMLAAVKNAAKVAPSNSPVKELNGILIECSDDTGEVFLTATNYEASIQHKVTASVEESGTMLVNSRLLVEMLSLLDCEFAAFSADRAEVLQVKGGKCIYTINCLPSKSYPKPVLPFPEETVKVSNIVSLAKRTVFAVSKDDSKPVLQCVNIRLRHNTVNAAACDGIRLIMVKDLSGTSEKCEYLLPAHSFNMLAAVSSDEDVFEVGDTGKLIVFVRQDMMFSMRKPVENEYIDTAAVIKSVKPVYTAATHAHLLKEGLDVIEVGASIEAGREPVNLIMSDNQIILRFNSDYSRVSSGVAANVSKRTPDSGFYYDIRNLLKLLQVIDGRVRIELDEKGYMLIKTKNEVYFQLPMKAPVNKTKPVKTVKKLEESNGSDDGEGVTNVKEAKKSKKAA